MWHFVLMLLICLSLTAYEVEAGTHILGGQAAKLGQFPYLASLQRRTMLGTFRHICGASIISPRLLVTAAHCLRYSGTPPMDLKPCELATLVGSVELYKNRGVVYPIERWVIHEKFNYITVWHDLGLLKTKSPIQFSEIVQPIKLLTQEIPAGAKLVVAGWGATATISILNNGDVIDGEVSNNTLYLPTKKLDIKICAQNYKDNAIGIEVSVSTNLCTDQEPGTGSCVGDSGGPLIHSGQLAGISSRIIWKNESGIVMECGLGPDIFTKISAYSNWIIKHEKLLMKSNKRKILGNH